MRRKTRPFVKNAFSLWRGRAAGFEYHPPVGTWTESKNALYACGGTRFLWRGRATESKNAFLL